MDHDNHGGGEIRGHFPEDGLEWSARYPRPANDYDVSICHETSRPATKVALTQDLPNKPARLDKPTGGRRHDVHGPVDRAEMKLRQTIGHIATREEPAPN
jgi:hypothetical protein